MRTKRFLSLLLAIAMLAAMTISASAAETSKVYLTEDFEDASKYASMDALRVTAGYGYWDEATGKYVHNTYDHDNDETTAEVTYWGASKTSNDYWQDKDGYLRKTTPAALRAAGTEHFLTYWNAGYTNTGISVGTNSNNDAALVLDPGAAGSNTARWYRIFPENWTANEDEAFVISYDFEAIGTYKTATYYGTTLYVDTSFIDSTGTATAHGSKVLMQTGYNANYESTMEMHPAYNANYSTASAHKEVELGKNYKFATVITANGDYMKRQSYLDGVKWDGSTTKGLTTTNTVEGLHIYLDGDDAWKVANVRAYTVSLADGAFNTSIENNELLPVSTTKVTVKFSQPIAEATFDADAVTVTENGAPMEEGTYFVTDVREVITAGGEIYSEVDVTFDELQESSEYVITFADTVANGAYVTLGSNNTASFTTAVPDIKIESFDIVKGWGGDAEATATAFTADGTLQGATLELTNTTEAAKNVAVIYAVYASNGQLTDVVYANRQVSANTTETIGSGMNLTAEGSVKAFVWDGISSLKPHSEATVKTIAAAN